MLFHDWLLKYQTNYAQFMYHLGNTAFKKEWILKVSFI